MTGFPASSGTEPSVPVASLPGANAQTVATLQAMLATMATLSQAQRPTAPAAPAVSPTTPAPAPPTPAPVVQATAVPPPIGLLTHGPWVVGSLYVIVPSASLMPIAEDAGLNHALALNAVIGISSSAMKSYKSQALVLAAFNEMLQYRMVVVIPT
ncbi:hypothetical protein B0H17DRAFT_1194510 [Mycena rosella]|uniref:Uncharacterized protein n=1 Tax=Mycena rosella TaxID=1033263 RepID=A0AAD7DZH4_MYCRO|nr:hypothetical protein B0H17DRAFT_1194510 [Mycena rosella]